MTVATHRISLTALRGALALALVGCAGAPVDPAPPLESRARPPIGLRLPRLGGGTVDLGALRGQPVLLFFFSTWSLRAQAEAKEMRRLAARYPGLAVVGVALDLRGRALVQTYVDFVGLTFPIALATPDDVTLIAALGRTSAVPRTVLIDAKGQIAQDHASGQTDFARLYRALDGMTMPGHAR